MGVLSGCTDRSCILSLLGLGVHRKWCTYFMMISSINGTLWKQLAAAQFEFIRRHSQHIIDRCICCRNLLRICAHRTRQMHHQSVCLCLCVYISCSLCAFNCFEISSDKPDRPMYAVPIRYWSPMRCLTCLTVIRFKSIQWEPTTCLSLSLSPTLAASCFALSIQFDNISIRFCFD